MREKRGSGLEVAEGIESHLRPAEASVTLHTFSFRIRRVESDASSGGRGEGV